MGSAGEVTHEMRRRAKAVNFGIVYGISDFSLSQDIGVTRSEAKAYMDKYFETYSGVRAYMIRRSCAPSSVRTGIFCKLGSTEDSRPVAVTVF